VTEQDYITGRKGMKHGNSISYRTPRAHTNAGMPTTTTAGHVKSQFLSSAGVDNINSSTSRPAFNKKDSPKRWIFKSDKNPQHTFLRMGSKAGDPMS
jgi:hypothetical protein